MKEINAMKRQILILRSNSRNVVFLWQKRGDGIFWWHWNESILQTNIRDLTLFCSSVTCCYLDFTFLLFSSVPPEVQRLYFSVDNDYLQIVPWLSSLFIRRENFFPFEAYEPKNQLKTWKRNAVTRNTVQVGVRTPGLGTTVGLARFFTESGLVGRRTRDTEVGVTVTLHCPSYRAADFLGSTGHFRNTFLNLHTQHNNCSSASGIGLLYWFGCYLLLRASCCRIPVLRNDMNWSLILYCRVCSR
jgi:hypothetical protein